MTRREALQTALAGTPAAALANRPQADRPASGRLPARITGIEVISLQKPLKERFWMANSPIGGFQPRASRSILKVHTDAGITGYGEGGGGVELFRSGFGDLV